MKIYQKIISFIFLFFICFSFAGYVLADPPSASSGGVDATSKGWSGTNSAGETSFPNPLGSIDTPQKLIGKIIDSILGIVGSIALLMFIYGGFTMMMAKGNEKQVGEGKDMIVWSSIGLIVIFLSYAMVKFVFTSLGV